MKLVVYGRKVWMNYKHGLLNFSSVKNSQVNCPEWPGLPWNLDEPESKNLMIQAKTLKEMRSMFVTWLIPDQRPHYLTKPEQYLTHLIGHEGREVFINP